MFVIQWKGFDHLTEVQDSIGSINKDQVLKAHESEIIKENEWFFALITDNIKGGIFWNVIISFLSTMWLQAEGGVNKVDKSASVVLPFGWIAHFWG